jgi:UDP-N-acetylenolpyruvoylglucosamine reductase
MASPEPSANERLASELASGLSAQAVVKANEPLAKRTTMRVGGPADLLVEPACEADLAATLRWCPEHRLPVFVLGRGSNLLVRDAGFRGVVITLGHAVFRAIEVSGENLNCGAGARLKAVAMEAKRYNLGGLEFLEGIPGSVGGALRMNAGAMGSWIFDVVEFVRVMDSEGRVETRTAAQMGATYRRCAALQGGIALGAVLKGRATARDGIQSRLAEYSRKRWSSQPAAPSAGCIFKNPAEISAGKLIDELGLKGTRVGGAVVSREHGNFIVNEGSATARDILELMDQIRERARVERGIELQIEVEVIGE